MEYLVTGGAGFIGSNVVRALVDNGRSVRVLDDFSTGRMENIADLSDKIELIDGDIREPNTAEKAVTGCRYVLHLAALPSVSRSVEDPILSNEVNLSGTANMLVASRDAGVERFVFASSSSVYGDIPTLPKTEQMTPAPLSPYAVQKLAGEHYCSIFHSLYGLRTYALRYFNVFGPRQNPDSEYAAVIPIFIKRLQKGDGPIVYGDGEQTRDFTFVEDVVNATLCCCDAREGAEGSVYNVACGKRTSVKELALKLAGMMGSDAQPVHRPSREGDVRDSQADPTRAREALGWEAAVEFDEGLRRTVEWFNRL